MSRFDIALGKKKPVKQALHKVKEKAGQSVIGPTFRNVQNRLRGLMGQTGVEELPGNTGTWAGWYNNTGVQGLTGVQGGQPGLQGNTGISVQGGQPGISVQGGQSGTGVSIQGQDQPGVSLARAISISSIPEPEQGESIFEEQIEQEMEEQAQEEEQAINEVAETLVNMPTIDVDFVPSEIEGWVNSEEAPERNDSTAIPSEIDLNITSGNISRNNDSTAIPSDIDLNINYRPQISLGMAQNFENVYGGGGIQEDAPPVGYGGGGIQEGAPLVHYGGDIQEGAPSVPPALIHSGETLSTRGPTSRHVMIAGPNGYRLMVPLRSLAYSISDNGNGSSTFHITIPTRDAEIIQQDIQAGLQRQEEVDRNRYG